MKYNVAVTSIVMRLCTYRDSGKDGLKDMLNIIKKDG